MNYLINKSRLLALRIFSAVAFTLVATGAWAQDTTSTSVRHGEASITTEVKNATIVYVEGNNLVLKLNDGRVEHLIVPLDEKFHVDGKEVTVTSLTPGTKLTQTITTTTTPRYVNTVRTLKGKVWHVNAPSSVILTLPDRTHHMYEVPSHAKFKINGQDKTVFDLRKGMNLEATIITDSPETVVASDKTTRGQAPALANAAFAGVLLIEPKSDSSAQAPSTVASVEALPAMLPETASTLPLIGMLGALNLAASVGLGFARKRARFPQA